jgi:hypothetical protein
MLVRQVVNSSEYFTFEAYTDMQCFQHLKTKPDTAGLCVRLAPAGPVHIPRGTVSHAARF